VEGAPISDLVVDLDETRPEAQPPPQPDTRPFFLPAGRTGCLLLHGFTATPHEMRFLGERLHAHGYTVSAMQIAGHCTSAEDLECRTWQDWYASAREGLMALQQHVPEIVVVGQSMGALLAVKLAVDFPTTIGGVVLLSPAFVLSRTWLRFVQPVLPLVLALLGERRRYVVKPDRDIADPQARVESPSYERVPLRGLVQLLQLQGVARRILPQVRQPVLVIHSRQDHTCPLVNAEIVARGAGGPVRTVILDDSYHVISIDVDKHRVAAEVAAFVEHTVGAAAAPHTSEI